jgi:hypothetical protein
MVIDLENIKIRDNSSVNGITEIVKSDIKPKKIMVEKEKCN